MARIRTIKPEFFRSRSLARCSRDARMTFAGLWCEADDFGRGVADARILKGGIWPLDDDITWQDVEKHLGELEETGHIARYEVNGEDFFEIVAWAEHQSSAYRRGKAMHPDANGKLPHDESCKNLQDARSNVLEGKGREGNEEGILEAAPPQATQKRKKAAHPLPEDWSPSDATREWAKAEYPQHATKGVLEDFKEHAIRTDRRQVNWDLAFKSWIRNEAKWHPAPATRAEKSGPARTHL